MSDLRGNSAPGKIRSSAGGKIVGGILLVIAVIVAGAFVYNTESNHHLKQVIAENQLTSSAPGQAQTAPPH